MLVPSRPAAYLWGFPVDYLDTILREIREALDSGASSEHVMMMEIDRVRQIETLLRELKERREQAAAKTKRESTYTYEDFQRQYDEARSRYGDHRYEDIFGQAFRFEEAWRDAFRAGFDGNYGNTANEQAKQREQAKQHARPNNARKRAWHEVLEVPVDSTRDTIMRAYRKLAARYHPDRAGGNHDRMAEINQAKDEGLAGL